MRQKKTGNGEEKKKGEKGRNKDLLNYGLLNIIPYKANTTIA